MKMKRWDSVKYDVILKKLDRFKVEMHLYTSYKTEQTVNIDSFGWRIVNVFFGEPCDQILTDHTVEGPTLVTSSHLLSHCGQETLRVEETRHPENLKKNV